MTSENKIWLCEQYAQKAWTLSLAFAQEAGRLGHFGRGYAIVAEETRTLAIKLFEYTSKVKFSKGEAEDFKGIADFAVMTGFLAINTMIEILRVNPMISDLSINKSVAVLAEDLRRLTLELSELSGTQVWKKSFIIPEAASPLKSTYTRDFFFHFSISGIPLVENTANIVEILYRCTEINDETIDIRGKKHKNVNCYKRFNLPFSGLYANWQPVMIIQPSGTTATNIPSEDICAVPIDDLDVNAIFQSRIGYAVPPKSDNIFSTYCRECWDAVGGGQLMFVDWQKFITE